MGFSQRRWTGLLVAGVMSLAPESAVADPPLRGRGYLEHYAEKFEATLAEGSPAALQAVVAAKEKRDFETVVRLTDEIIARDATRFDDPAVASWSKAHAYVHRGNAKYELSRDPSAGVTDLIAAARLGHYDSTFRLTDNILRHQLAGSALAVGMPNDVEPFLRIGADLGSAWSAQLLGGQEWRNTLAEDEKAYWLLVGRAGSNDLVPEQRQFLLRDAAARRGREELTQAIERYSPLGRLRPAGPRGLPGRGIYATAFVDWALRNQYGGSYGRMPALRRPAVTPTVVEVFESIAAMADIVGVSNAFLIVPGNRTFSDPAILPLSPEETAGALGAGDIVVVRCGPISHLAFVYRVDRSQGWIEFADGLYQYWQPSHNSCVTRFDLVSLFHGGYLARVPLQEVLPMIQGLITLRDRVPLGAPSAASATSRAVHEFAGSRVVPEFRLEAVLEQLSPTESTYYYAPARDARDVSIRLQVDNLSQITVAELTIARQRLTGPGVRTLRAEELLAQFLEAVTPESLRPSLDAMVSALRASGTRPSGKVKKGSARSCDRALVNVLLGRAVECRSETAQQQVWARNTTDASQRPMLEVVVRTPTTAESPQP